MSARPADPTRTHAVLVGVEKYAAGKAWDLPGPVRDVLEFGDWLLSRGLPADQIQMLLSPSDASAALLDQSKLKSTPATSGNVRQAITALHGKGGDLLIIFWAGHGMVYENQHRLFFTDATEADKRNLDFDALRQSLQTTYFRDFPRQILIVDACANYAKFPFTLPNEYLPKGDVMPHEQFIFFAARPGEVAKNLGEEKRGLFSQELFKQIQLQGNSIWPPDMRSLAERVQGAFVELRASGQATQTPIYEWNRDWQGNAIELKESLLDKPGLPLKELRTFPISQLRTLCDALSVCAGMTRPTERDDVLSQLRSEISGAVPRRSDTKGDVFNIVQTTSKYPGGLEELLETVRWFSGDSVPWQRVQKVVADHFPGLDIEATALEASR